MSGGDSFLADDGFKDLVLQQLADIKERINNLPCRAQGETLRIQGETMAALKQSFDNHKDEEKRLFDRRNIATNIWRVVLTIISIIIAALVAIERYK